MITNYTHVCCRLGLALAKPLQLALTLSLLSATAHAQCDSLEAQGARLIAELDSLQLWSDEIAPATKLPAGSFAVGLLSAQGDREAQLVTVTLLFMDVEVPIYALSTGVRSVVLDGGREVLLERAVLGGYEPGLTIFQEYAEGPSEINLDPGIPVRARYYFRGVPPEATSIATLLVPTQYREEGTRNVISKELTFEAIPITWE